ncbi:Breast carcinoma-amplified sequence 3, partial [Orchesella cincta]
DSSDGSSDYFDPVKSPPSRLDFPTSKMSADSLRKGSMMRHAGSMVRPQTVTEKTLMESVAGFINEVGLVTQPSSGNEDKENCITWTKFEDCRSHGLKLAVASNFKGESCHTAPPLLLTLGYQSGVQMWAIPANGEAHEILSWKKPNVRLFQLLPNPAQSDKDQFRAARPVVVICEGSNSPTSSNQLTFVSFRSGEPLKTNKFMHPVCDILANQVAIVVTFLDKIILIDPRTFEIRTTISSAERVSTIPFSSPVALGSSWLAYTERKLLPIFQSSGGVEMANTTSYTASVLYAAKSLTKGLKGLGETVANSITGHRVTTTSESELNSTVEPGIVTILDLNELKQGEVVLSDLSGLSGLSTASVIAHFVAHMNNPVVAMSFDHSGLLLVTADKEGHDFNVFRIHPHPLGASMAAVHHLYVLHRGDTVAKVQSISFAPDSRWVAVSTLRGTTHIFPITPYGGHVSARTHTSHRVVNRLSRFHRTAGLDDAPTSGRNSPVSAFNPGPVGNSVGKSFDLCNNAAPYPNPRLPPFPHPIMIPPMAQLRQSFATSSSSTSPKNSPPVSKSKGLCPEDRNNVLTVFESPRSWHISSSPVVPTCGKKKKPAVDALFIMTSYGNLIEYCLDPKATSGTVPGSGVTRDKISDDASIKLSVHAKAQWNFTKPSFTKELQPPLQPNNLMLLPTCYLIPGDLHLNCNDSKVVTFDGEDNMDERWLSQVEICTHSGPHRRLWMGPQFTFKVFNSNSSKLPLRSMSGGLDVETVEVNVTNRPAKSNPVNMPASSSLIPVVIEGSSGSSLEQSPRLADPYCDSETSVVHNESQLKENLADAMMENCGGIARETGGCQSLGSCDDISSTSSFESTSQTSIDAPAGRKRKK